MDGWRDARPDGGMNLARRALGWRGIIAPPFSPSATMPACQLAHAWRTRAAWMFLLAVSAWLVWAAIECYRTWGPAYAGVMAGNLAGGWLLAGVLRWAGGKRLLQARAGRMLAGWVVVMACLGGCHAAAGFMSERAAAKAGASVGAPDAQHLALVEARGTLAAQTALTADIETLTRQPGLYRAVAAGGLPRVTAVAFFDSNERAAFSSTLDEGDEPLPIFLSTAYLDSMQPVQARAVVGHELWHILVRVRAGAARERTRNRLSAGLAGLLVLGLGGIGLARWNPRQASLAAACLGVVLATASVAGVGWMAQGQRQEELDADAFGARLTSRAAMGGALTAIYSACSKAPANDVWTRGFLSDHPDWRERMRALGLDPGRACG